MLLKEEEVVVTTILVMVGQTASPGNLAQELMTTMAMEVLVVGLMYQPFQWDISL